MFQPPSQESLILQPLKQLPLIQVLLICPAGLSRTLPQQMQAQLPEKNIPQKMVSMLSQLPDNHP